MSRWFKLIREIVNWSDWYVRRTDESIGKHLGLAHAPEREERMVQATPQEMGVLWLKEYGLRYNRTDNDEVTAYAYLPGVASGIPRNL